jgi:nicotinamidase-related amidase
MPLDRQSESALPDFFLPSNSGAWNYAAEAKRVFDEAAKARRSQSIPPASEDRSKVHLLLVDLQRDFCMPEGTLFVAGRSGRAAIDDNARIAAFIYRNLSLLSDITCTADLHFPFQIFFPAFWTRKDGSAPPPHTIVTSEQVRSGELLPDPPLAGPLAGGDYNWLRRQALSYTESLEKSGKYVLYLWPPHCLAGTPGQCLAGIIHEAVLYHSYARVACPAFVTKGDSALTENYSVLAPEVSHSFDGRELAVRNVSLIEKLLHADAVAIAGQAASHCVMSTVDDLLMEIDRRDPAMARRLFILQDCMSPVVVTDPAVPGKVCADFSNAVAAAIERWRAAGVNVVDSSVPVHEWGIR